MESGRIYIENTYSTQYSTYHILFIIRHGKKLLTLILRIQRLVRYLILAILKWCNQNFLIKTTERSSLCRNYGLIINVRSNTELRRTQYTSIIFNIDIDVTSLTNSTLEWNWIVLHVPPFQIKCCISVWKSCDLRYRNLPSLMRLWIGPA
jgi:hypothetical protein